MGKIVLICSGGMDSVTLLHKAVKERGAENVEVLTFNYNSKHNKCEIPMATANCEKLGVKQTIIDMGFINDNFESALLSSGDDIPEGHYADESMKQTVVPFRNGIMLSIAAGFAESKGANKVTLGNHFGDHAIYPDCRGDFVKTMSEAMRLGTYNGVTIEAPFTDITKTDIAAIGDKLGVDFSLTWTCYKGKEIHCGVCGSCTERKEAFADSGVKDVTVYEQ